MLSTLKKIFALRPTIISGKISQQTSDALTPVNDAVQNVFLSGTDIDFVEQTLPQLRGWLFSEAAYMTCHLIRSQTSWAIQGSGLEIGVYEGRYLALLQRLLAERSDVTIGIDTFQFIPMREVVDKMNAVIGENASKLTFHMRDSSSVHPEELCNWTHGRPAIISIDGDHSAKAVKQDLYLADAVMSSGGLTIVDDFMNHFAVGVTEGVYSYLADKNAGLIPCIFIGQKLFFCRPEYLGKYQSAAFAFGQSARLKACEVFRKYLSLSREYVEPSIAGHKVVMFVSPYCDATYTNP